MRLRLPWLLPLDKSSNGHAPNWFEHMHCDLTLFSTCGPAAGAEPVSLGPGDFVTIAAGLEVTWDIKEGVSKHWK